MAMALADLEFAVNLLRQCVGFDFASPRAQPHRTAKFFDSAQLAQLVNYAMRSRRLELARIRIRQSNDVAGTLNTRSLHSQANSKVGNFFLARITNRNQHSFNAALAENSGHQQPVISFKLRFDAAFVGGFQSLGFDPVQVKLERL